MRPLPIYPDALYGIPALWAPGDHELTDMLSCEAWQGVRAYLEAHCEGEWIDDVICGWLWVRSLHRLGEEGKARALFEEWLMGTYSPTPAFWEVLTRAPIGMPTLQLIRGRVLQSASWLADTEGPFWELWLDNWRDRPWRWGPLWADPILSLLVKTMGPCWHPWNGRGGLVLRGSAETSLQADTGPSLMELLEPHTRALARAQGWNSSPRIFSGTNLSASP